MSVSPARLPAPVRAFLLVCVVTLLLPAVPADAQRSAAPPLSLASGTIRQRPAPKGQPPISSTPAPRPAQTPMNERARAHTPANPQGAAQPFGHLPLPFAPNVGQADASVRYLVKSPAGTVFFRPDEVVIGVPNVGKRERPHPTNPIAATKHISVSLVRIRYQGATPRPTVEAGSLLPGKAAYFLGNDRAKWRSDVSTYGSIVYRQLYPGIDLHYEGTDGELKSTYIVAPGIDPATIQWRYQGSTDVQVDQEGNLVITVPPGKSKQAGQPSFYTLIEEKPIAWQDIRGQRLPVSVRYSVATNKRVSFVLGPYDRTQPLIIDPTLRYSTFFGGSADDTGEAIAVDSTGTMYIVGTTSSTDLSLANPLDTALSGDSDIFVTKIDALGQNTLYSTYIGGNDDDSAADIAIDSDTAIYITGSTFSTDFPTVNSAQSTIGGNRDAIAAKISANGSSFVYSTYLGGSGNDGATGIALADDGTVSLAGSTQSPNFPTTTNAYDTTCSTDGLCTGSYTPSSDGFVTTLSANGGTRLYSTYLGGYDIDTIIAIAGDGSGTVAVTGVTNSSATTFPIKNALQSTFTGGPGKAFVAKLDPGASGASSLEWNTYLGGSGAEFGAGIAVDSTGDVYITGNTTSTNFPTTSGAAQRQHGGGSCTSEETGAYPCPDAFLTKFASDGSAYRFSTYLGGPRTDAGVGIAVDSEGTVFVGGGTAGAWPLMAPFQVAYSGGAYDGFVARLSASGKQVLYSTCLGGTGSENVSALALDPNGALYLVGATTSPAFPLVNPLQAAYGDEGDAFVAKIQVAKLADTQAVGVEECLCQDRAAHEITGEPVNTRTGNFSTQVTDLSVLTPGAPLVWTRSYASQTTGIITGALGYGWQHPYGARLIVATDAVTVVSGVGNQLRFTTTPSGTYEAAPGIYSTLAQSGSTYIQTKRDQSL